MSVFTAQNLYNYDGILFNNNSDLNFDNPEARKILIDFVKKGKGVIGIHAATMSFKNFPEAAEMLGGIFDKHPWTSEGTWMIKVTDTDHLLTEMFEDENFALNDEIYRIEQRRLRDNCRVLVALDMQDEKNLAAEGVRITDRDIPISWIRRFGDGRVFYCSLGHNKNIYWDPVILKHYLAGIQFALGDLDVDATPVPLDIADAIDIDEIEKLLNEIRTYEYGQSREKITLLSDLLRMACNSAEIKEDVESELTDFLDSDASLPAKRIACEFLSIYGGDDSIPIISDMMYDSSTSDMAFFALERIPGDLSNQVFREALNETNGKEKVRVITVLGDRQLKDSIKDIAPLVWDTDPRIASAAISSLGKISGDQAVLVLSEELKRSTDRTRKDLIDAYINCATVYEYSKQKKKATTIYTTLFQPEFDLQVRYAAMRGLLRTSDQSAEEIIVSNLENKYKENHSLAARCLDVLPPDQNMNKITALLPQLAPAVQIEIISALAGRTDSATLKTLTVATQSQSAIIRIEAYKALALSGDSQSVPLLANAAASSSGKERSIARESLDRVNAKGVDEVILKSISVSADPLKAELIRSTSNRDMKEAVPVLMNELANPESNMRIEAIKALQHLASPENLDQLLEFHAGAKADQERKELEKTIVTIAKKSPENQSQAAPLLNRFNNIDDISIRSSYIIMMGKIGDPASLDMLRSALTSETPEIKESAIRALADWPDTQVLEDLNAIIKTTKNKKYHVIAFRGYVRLVALDENSTGEEKFTMFDQSMQMAINVDEKRMVLSQLPQAPHEASLQLAENYLKDPELKREAEMAVFNIVVKLQEVDKDRILTVLKKVREQTNNEDLKEQCTELIKYLMEN
jgi:type 1 glutamine amidotransferase/HEAT repeat protein